MRCDSARMRCLTYLLATECRDGCVLRNDTLRGMTHDSAQGDDAPVDPHAASPGGAGSEAHLQGGMAGVADAGAAEPTPGFDLADFAAPSEPPPLELWRAVGDVKPWGTRLLVLAWGIVFVWQALLGEFGDTAALVARGANIAPHGVWDAAWRALACTFLHESPSHVFFNAVTLLVLGQAVERILARGGFAIVAVLGGAVASAGSLAWRMHSGDEPGLAIGGSGVVFAMGGAALATAVRLRSRLAVGRARAYGGVVLFLTLPSLAEGLARHGTDSAAHACGLLAGAALGAFVPLREALGGPRDAARVRAAGALAACVLAVVFALVLRG